MEKDFTLRANQIIQNIEDTNYDSIMAQMKFILLIQEFLIKFKLSNDQILDFFDKISSSESDNEALIETLGEIGSNLTQSHRCKPIWVDLGESYISFLMKLLQRFEKDGSLLRKCNS